MKLYWSPRSPFARKVMVFAHEAGLADRIECVRTLVAMSRPNRELMRLNPLGKIPTLVTAEGGILYDSTVICEYLDTLHGRAPLFPPAGDARFAALRWHALGDNLLDNLVLWRNERLRPPPQQSAELIRALESKTKAAVEFLQGEAAALAGTAVGIGHIAIGCALGYIDFRFPELDWRSGHGRLSAWYAQFEQRPSMRRTMPQDES